MARRASPLAETWAWLAGLVLPAGALVVALALTLSGESAPVAGIEPSTTTTTLVAGASASLSSQSTTSLAAGPAPQSATDLRPDVAVAGLQIQAPAPLPQSPFPDTSSPLIGRVGGHAVPIAFPIAALVTMVAGFAWRVHTSAPWPSKNPRSPLPLQRRHSLQKRSALA